MSTSEAYAPLAGLLVGSDGLLYGTTSLGAVGIEANTTGTVFRIKTDGTGFTILHRFAAVVGVERRRQRRSTPTARIPRPR